MLQKFALIPGKSVGVVDARKWLLLDLSFLKRDTKKRGISGLFCFLPSHLSVFEAANGSLPLATFPLPF